MRINLSVPEDEVTDDRIYQSDVLGNKKPFPILNIGRDSYIVQAVADVVFDKNMIYNVQVGRHTSIAHDVTFVIDLNHDYKRVCQGRIGGVEYSRPELIKRKGQIIIMNDCWVGEGATILGGVTLGNGSVVSANAVVTKDVPPYAIVAGDPAKIIGYRFEKEDIESLNLIKWWNWPKDKVLSQARLLLGDVKHFISANLKETVDELANIEPVQVNRIEKHGQGEEKIFLYVPDFEQAYPTYPRVIDAFAKSFAGTNHELLLYIEKDELLEDKLSVLDKIFALYENVDCYINLHIDNVSDIRGLVGQADAYVTNRSVTNVQYMDAADTFGIPVISSVDVPVFSEKSVQKMVH